MNENNLIINNWKIDDLYNPKFWDYNLGKIFNNPYEQIYQFFKNITIPLGEKVSKIQMIEHLWNNLPKSLRFSLFENDIIIYNMWVDLIEKNNFVKFHDLLIQKKYDIVFNFVKNNEEYKKIYSSKKHAFSDMKEVLMPKDEVLLKFYSKLTNENVISLNTPEYIMVSGIDKSKVDDLKLNLVKEKYILIYTLNFDHKGKNIPIYIFQPNK